MKIKFFIIYFVTCLFVNSFTFAEEKSPLEEPQLKGINFYTGIFDFSDDGQR